MNDETFEKAKKLKEDIEYFKSFRRTLVCATSQNTFHLEYDYKIDMESYNFGTNNFIAEELGVNKDISALVVKYITEKINELQKEYDAL